MLQSVQELVANRYAAVHGASQVAEFPHYCTVQDGEGPCATLGFRNASEGRLFLEAYLDHPIEQVVCAALGGPITRDRIVEIGAHASQRPRATIALWARAAADLVLASDVAVAVLTAPMRAMFERLGLPISILGRADRHRLEDGGAAWGRYYEADPMVCAGEIAAARPVLLRW